MHTEVKKLVNYKEIEFFLVLETKIRPNKVQAIKDVFGLEWDSHNNGDPSQTLSADSIWTFWRKNLWSVDILKTHQQYMHLRLKNTMALELLYTPVYGENNREERKILWNGIQQIGSITTLRWLIGRILMKLGLQKKEQGE